MDADSKAGSKVTADSNKILLSVRDLVVEYTSDDQIIHAVNNVSFDVRRGETLGLVGETGAGKTSIAKSILRILPDPPAKIRNGSVFFEGEDIMLMREEKLRQIRGRRISMVFQDPMTALNPVMRIGNQVAEVIRLHSEVSNAEAQERAREMLEMVGITRDRFFEYPHQFSGGMKQRVIIAIALACKPDLLLADEPTTALDVTIQGQVLDMIKDLKDRLRTSMILITHDLGIVAEICDSVAVVYAGEIIEYGSKEDIFLHAAHPYTLGLFGALPDMNSETERLYPIDGMTPDPTNLPIGCKFSPRCPQVKPECESDVIPLKNLSEKHQCRCLLYACPITSSVIAASAPQTPDNTRMTHGIADQARNDTEG